jgi:hypothetical protein
MSHRREIDSILAQVTPWPEEDRLALAYDILREARGRTRQPAPRKTLFRALGIAGGQSPPPDDATVDQWMAEHRLRKHG